MVFVWSYLSKGDAAYTQVQVVVNDLIILVAFTPIVAFLLGVGDVIIPLDTLLLSIGLLLTLVILFSFQGETILQNPLYILLIAIPLVLQTYLIFALAYRWAKAWHLPYEVAAMLVVAFHLFETYSPGVPYQIINHGYLACSR